jgi:propionate CoA-transferase
MNNQQVLYVTERAVFRLEADGLALIEVAPGLDVADLLSKIPFLVRVQEPLGRMPEDIFQPTVAHFELPARPAGRIRVFQGR